MCAKVYIYIRVHKLKYEVKVRMKKSDLPPQSPISN